MKDEGSISQEELDALLNGGSTGEKKTTKKTGAKKSTAKKTSDKTKTEKTRSAKEPAKVTKTKAAAKKAPAKKVDLSKSKKKSTIDSVKVEVTVLLGSKQYSVEELENAEEGSILELEKLAGEPVDVLANGVAIAKGEVVLVDDNFAVRLTDIL